MTDPRILTARHNRAVDECFDGTGPRKCSTCIASPGNGGECCFGDPDAYDSDDPACRSCRHRPDCKEIVFDKIARTHEQTSQKTYTSRRTTSRQPLVQIGGRPRYPDTTTSRPIGGGTPTVIHRSPSIQRQYDEDDRTLTQIFVDDMVWGTAEAWTGIAHEFFKHYKPGGKYRR